eukprot:Hpha_TRINITY_DN16908_c0_g13::TRINITY_DN16908_c0_g13_i1::g.53737::m.53737
MQDEKGAVSLHTVLEWEPIFWKAGKPFKGVRMPSDISAVSVIEMPLKMSLNTSDALSGDALSPISESPRSTRCMRSQRIVDLDVGDSFVSNGDSEALCLNVLDKSPRAGRGMRRPRRSTVKRQIPPDPVEEVKGLGTSKSRAWKGSIRRRHHSHRSIILSGNEGEDAMGVAESSGRLCGSDAGATDSFAGSRGRMSVPSIRSESHFDAAPLDSPTLPRQDSTRLGNNEGETVEGFIESRLEASGISLNPEAASPRRTDTWVKKPAEKAVASPRGAGRGRRRLNTQVSSPSHSSRPEDYGDVGLLHVKGKSATFGLLPEPAPADGQEAPAKAGSLGRSRKGTVRRGLGDSVVVATVDRKKNK